MTRNNAAFLYLKHFCLLSAFTFFRMREHPAPLQSTAFHYIPGLSHPFLGIGPGPLELGKIALF